MTRYITFCTPMQSELYVWRLCTYNDCDSRLSSTCN